MDPSDDIFKYFPSGNSTSVNDPATSQDGTKQNVFSTDLIPGDLTSGHFDDSATREDETEQDQYNTDFIPGDSTSGHFDDSATREVETEQDQYNTDFIPGDSTSAHFDDSATTEDETEQDQYNTEFIPGDSTSENFDGSATRQMGEEEEVLGILEIHDITDAATLGLGPEVLSLNGSHICIKKSGTNDEYYVMVEEKVNEGSSQVLNDHCEVNQELVNDEYSLAADTFHNFEQLHLPCGNSDDSQNEAPFISIGSSTMDSPEEIGISKNLLHSTVEVRKSQIEDTNCITFQHIQNCPYPQSITEVSAIDSQIQAGTDFDLDSNFADLEYSAPLTNKHFGEVNAGLNEQVETPKVESKTSFPCISSNRTLDDAVSVTHTTAPICIQDFIKGAEISDISNDYVTHESGVSLAKSDKSEDSEVTLHANFNLDSYPFPNDNILNLDDDIVFSQNSELDPSKELNFDYTVCSQGFFPALGLSKVTHDIGDSLNKNKQSPYYGTSEEKDNFNNSPSGLTNIADDIQSVSENSTKQVENNASESSLLENSDEQIAFNELCSNTTSSVSDLLNAKENLLMPSQRALGIDEGRKTNNVLMNSPQKTCIIKDKVKQVKFAIEEGKDENEREKVENAKERSSNFVCNDLSSTNGVENVDSQKNTNDNCRDEVEKSPQMDDKGNEPIDQDKVAVTCKRKRKNIEQNISLVTNNSPPYKLRRSTRSLNSDKIPLQNKNTYLEPVCSKQNGPLIPPPMDPINDTVLHSCVYECGFVSYKINNIIIHRKCCSLNTRKKSNKSPLGFDLQDFPACCQEDCSDKHNHITKFGFAEKDIVWFKSGKLYWPALVWVVLKEEILFYIITSYKQSKAIKIKITSVEKYVHSFEDEKWTKENVSKYADECERRNFFKALQQATSYVGKKAFSKSVDAKQFFGITEEGEFLEVDGDSSDAETEKIEKWDCGVPVYYCPTLVSKFLSCIFNGECDQHVVSIYARKIPSERHELYLRPNVPAAQQRLHDMSWFGPFRTDLTMQPRIYDYLYSLHKKFISGKPIESYIRTVWIPESIVKAISLVNHTSMMEADIFFLALESKIPLNDFLDESSDEEIPGYEFDFDDCFMDTSPENSSHE